MQLRDDWKRLVKRAWSLRLIALASLLSGGEVAVSILSNDPPIPRGSFAVLAMLVTMASGVARVVVQSGITPPDARS